MRFGKIAAAYSLIFLIYLIVLLMADKSKGFFEYGALALTQLTVIIPLSLLSYFLRYLRWYWLLTWSGNSVPFLGGWWAYLSGFALTASPGKVGELLRIRYFSRFGISAERVISAFVFERSLDLAVVFFFAAMVIPDLQMIWLAFSITVLFLVSLFVAVIHHKKITQLGLYFMQKRWLEMSRFFKFLANVLESCGSWIKLPPMIIGLTIGVAAWSVTSFSFVYLLDQLNIQIPWLDAFSMYPIAMLTGAASMIPGGFGSTEASIVMQLNWHSVDTATGLVVAVVIRLGTLWLSIFSGLLAILIQEFKIQKASN